MVSSHCSSLDLFLRRTLLEETYARIRGYEAAIVCSQSEKKAYKFVVLTDEWIYLTENPPKTIKKRVAIAHISDVHTENDLPDFLEGDERNKALHVVVRYRQEVRKLEEEEEEAEEEEDKLESASCTGRKGKKGKKGNKVRNRESSKGKSAKYNRTDEMIGNGGEGGSSGERLPPLRLSRQTGRIRTNGHVESEDRREANGARKTNDVKETNSVREAKDGRKVRDGMEAEKETIEWEENELHLYIVKLVTEFLVLLRAAWQNYLIRGTLHRDPLIAGGSVSLTSHCPRPGRSSGSFVHHRKLFAQLCDQIVSSGVSLETSFFLVAELKAATQRNFFLKKLFWKQPEVFHHLIHILQTYLPSSATCTTSLHHHDEINAALEVRADEIELLILVLETLWLEFRETEVLPSRQKALRSKQGKPVRDLFILLTSLPELPRRKTSDKEGPQLVTLNVQLQLEKLTEELTDIAGSVMCELLQISLQVFATENKGKFLKITWIIKVLESLPNLGDFLDLLVSRCLLLLAQSKIRPILAPRDAVLVFQLYSVLSAIINHSDFCLNFVQLRFTEDFRYLLRLPVVERKLPLSYPISQQTLSLVESVVHHIDPKRRLK